MGSSVANLVEAMDFLPAESPGDDKKAQSLLFCGQHTRKLHTPTPQGPFWATGTDHKPAMQAVQVCQVQHLQSSWQKACDAWGARLDSGRWRSVSMLAKAAFLPVGRPSSKPACCASIVRRKRLPMWKAHAGRWMQTAVIMVASHLKIRCWL